MQPIELSLHQAHKGLAPPEWFLSKELNLQRLYYIIGGSGFIRENGSSRRLLPGCFYLLPSNLDLELYTLPSDPINHIYFDFFSTPPIISPEVIVYRSEGTAATLASFLDSTIMPRGSTVDKEDYDELMLELLRVSLMTLSSQKPIPFMNDRIVSETLDHIRRHYFEPITASQLASRLGFEVNYFIRKFRSLTGTTPYACLRSYRLARARELISAGETVARAAVMVGYENASSLSRALRERK